MKHTAPSSPALRAALTLALLLAPVAPAFADWASERVETKRQVFEVADVNRNGNIDPEERDRLRELFSLRADFGVIDLNGNRRLEREEIDSLELEIKAENKKKREEVKVKEDKEKDAKKKKEKKRKKN